MMTGLSDSQCGAVRADCKKRAREMPGPWSARPRVPEEKLSSSAPGSVARQSSRCKMRRGQQTLDMLVDGHHSRCGLEVGVQVRMAPLSMRLSSSGKPSRGGVEPCRPSSPDQMTRPSSIQRSRLPILLFPQILSPESSSEHRAKVVLPRQGSFWSLDRPGAFCFVGEFRPWLLSFVSIIPSCAGAGFFWFLRVRPYLHLHLHPYPQPVDLPALVGRSFPFPLIDSCGGLTSGGGTRHGFLDYVAPSSRPRLPPRAPSALYCIVLDFVNLTNNLAADLIVSWKRD